VALPERTGDNDPVSTFFEPRVVEKPYQRRWLRMTLQLVVRSPVRFAIMIALLAWLDTSALQWVQGVAIPRQWIERLGMVGLPFIWAAVAAIARGADDSTQTWRALEGFLRVRVWFAILMAGASLVALSWAVSSLLSPAGAASSAYANQSGQLLRTFGAQSVLVYMMFGPCFAPLCTLAPGLSVLEVLRLSHRATQINDLRVILLMMLLVAGVLSFLPAFGMTAAAWLVFMGTLNYVAYRDIFERRAANFPLQTAGAQVLDSRRSLES
jgi:hypothetical protein